MPDNIFINVIAFAVCLFILMKGADWLIDGSSVVARKLKVSELLIGLTVVAFGTSLPEFVVSIGSAMQGSAELAYANVIGSNIANILLILGATSLIMPLKSSEEVHSDVYFLMGLVVTFAMVVIAGKSSDMSPFLFESSLGTIGGLCLLAFFIGFIVRIHLKRQKGIDEFGGTEDHQPEDDTSLSKAVFWLVCGLVMIVAGGELTVQSAINIAQILNVPESTIGLTIVAFGTSLPELVASLAAAGKGKGDMAIGGILGSNLMNLSFVLGTSATFFPIKINSWGVFDMFIHTAVSVGFLLLMARRTEKDNLNKQTGIIFIILYVAYMTVIGVRDFVT